MHNRVSKIRKGKYKGKTPYEAWFKRKPTIAHLRPWGVRCLWKPDQPGFKPKHKFEAPWREALFMGYQWDKPGYEVYDVKTSKFVPARNVKFPGLAAGELTGWVNGLELWDGENEQDEEEKQKYEEARETRATRTTPDAHPVAGEQEHMMGFGVAVNATAVTETDDTPTTRDVASRDRGEPTDFSQSATDLGL